MHVYLYSVALFFHTIFCLNLLSIFWVLFTVCFPKSYVLKNNLNKLISLEWIIRLQRSIRNINKQIYIYTICYISDINLDLNTRSDCNPKQTKSNFLVSMQIILTSESSITNVWMSFSPLSNFTNVGWFLCWYNVSTKTTQVADIYVWTLSVHI